MYDNLSHKIDVDPNSVPNLLEGEYAVFSNTHKTNHSAIIKVLFSFNNIEVSNKNGVLSKLDFFIICKFVYIKKV
jgi:hypothetical protein